ncbi:CDP-alcohol phosphatidyltransferase family protein [Pseudooceanicola algae]|uniref:Uncharacterized protein n=1 Tax=Pseudooceanicola algae TaxID=1537215 RepID=A0A418SC47_9RHOB|nr:CDP-alcohol phosphatidyltransferase family protein [Pseudooceanicola algae]QPM89944.1 hypothetical protein PSAL_011740 [Pseudooceanicola algae]
MAGFAYFRLRALDGPFSRALGSPPRSFLAAVLLCVPAVGLGAAVLCATAPTLAANLAIALFLTASALTYPALRGTYPHPALGACNLITTLRMAMVCVLGAAVAQPVPHAVPLFTLAMVALALDGVDGWLARRSGLVSGFGARFDMEVDAALAAVLALLLIRMDDGGIGPTAALMVLGAARYAFVAAAMMLPWLRRPLPFSQARRAICVVQIAALSLLLLVGPASLAGRIGLTLAAALILWSFGRDILWLYRRRGLHCA